MTESRYHPFARLFCCVLGLVIASIVMVTMLYVGSALATVWTGRNPTAQLQEIVAAYEIPLLLLSYPAQIVWISYCRTRLDGFSFGSLGLRMHRILPNAARGALTGGLGIGLLWAILWLSGLVSVTGWSTTFTQLSPAGAAWALFGYAAAFLAVGIFEEILFRGYVLQNLNNWLGWKSAVLVQGVLFALVHLLNVINEPAQHQAAALGAMPALFLIAVFFAVSYRKTGSLWFPIGFHFAWNFCLGPVFSLPVSGVDTFRLMDVTLNESDWLTGGPFGAEGSVLLIPILLALIYFISLAPDHPQTVLDLNLLSREEVPIPQPMSISEEPEEGERESRFRTKFGTSQGFSADTLRELRDLQEEREKTLREAEEARKREALAKSSFAPAVAQPQPAIEVTPVESAPLEEKPTAPMPIPAAPPAPAPTAAPTPAPVTPPSAPSVPPTASPTAPPATPPVKKKPSSPRW